MSTMQLMLEYPINTPVKVKKEEKYGNVIGYTLNEFLSEPQVILVVRWLYTMEISLGMIENISAIHQSNVEKLN